MLKLFFYFICVFGFSSCGFIRYMSTKDQRDVSREEIKTYLVKNKLFKFNYSLKMVREFLPLLSEKEHVLDLYKLKKGTEQSSMQIRIYGKNDSLISAYTQCYSKLYLRMLKKREFIKYYNLPNNYSLNFKDEFELFDEDKQLKDRIYKESYNKNKIVVYWNIWSNYYSKVMLKKVGKYIHKFDPDLTRTTVILLNNDYNAKSK